MTTTTSNCGDIVVQFSLDAPVAVSWFPWQLVNPHVLHVDSAQPELTPCLQKRDVTTVLLAARGMIRPSDDYKRFSFHVILPNVMLEE